MKEWAVVKQAPISLVVGWLLGLTAIWLLLRRVYQERLEHKDDIIAAYKEKLGLAPSSEKKRADSEVTLAKTEIEGEVHPPNTNQILDKPTSDEHFKLILEPDFKSRRSQNGGRNQRQLFIAHDQRVFEQPELEKPVQINRYLIKAAIRVRFDNQDSNTGAVRKLSVSLRRETRDGEKRETPISLLEIRDVDTGLRLNFDEIVIAGSRLTPYYWLECEGQLDPVWEKLLDRHCFLRITMEALRAASLLRGS
jgi:hypothetical protein